MAIRRIDSPQIPVSQAIFRLHCRISLDAFFDELAVPSGVDCALSAASRTVTGVAELVEPFDGPLNLWRRDAKLSRNVAVRINNNNNNNFIETRLQGTIGK